MKDPICILCGSDNIVGLNRLNRPVLKELENIKFVDIQFKCEECGYSFNCVGAKT